MSLLYVVIAVACCYILDALCTTLTHRRLGARVRALQAEVRASLAARGKRHV
jgi:hypothetical protein